MLMIFKDPPYGSWVDQRENLAAINDILCTKLVIVMLLYKVMGSLMHFVNDFKIFFHCHLNVSIRFPQYVLCLRIIQVMFGVYLCMKMLSNT